MPKGLDKERRQALLMNLTNGNNKQLFIDELELFPSLVGSRSLNEVRSLLLKLVVLPAPYRDGKDDIMIGIDYLYECGALPIPYTAFVEWMLRPADDVNNDCSYISHDILQRINRLPSEGN